MHILSKLVPVTAKEDSDNKMIAVATTLLVIVSVLTPVLSDTPPVYGGAQGRGGGGQDPLGDLGETIPGEPSEDYPILGSVPDTSFVCDGQVEGGYYADPEGECQVFHILKHYLELYFWGKHPYVIRITFHYPQFHLITIIWGQFSWIPMGHF